MTTFKDDLKALCKKDGFMRSGQQFCHEGRVYKYTFYKTDSKYQPSLPFNVATDTKSYSHSMGTKFFNEYFTPMSEFLTEELFEI